MLTLMPKRLSENFGNFVVNVDRCIATPFVVLSLTNGNSMITLVESKGREAPDVKENGDTQMAIA
jgi:hypothetical protein